MSDPYYSDDLATLWHGDFRDVPEWLGAAVLLTDPPYGIGYRSGSRRDTLAASIAGDHDTSLRDEALTRWGWRPALVFGSWRAVRPRGTQARIVWDTKGALGMGDLSIPWKPSDQEIYVLGHTADRGFRGRRESNVVVCPPVQATSRGGRQHPHEKPVALLAALMEKCPPGSVADPFAGSGSTGVAAKMMGRRSLLVESEERYCEIAAKRLAATAALPFEEDDLFKVPLPLSSTDPMET